MDDIKEISRIKKDMEKIKFQIKNIGKAINYKDYPIPYLIIEMNWDEEDISRAYDIFKSYNDKLEKGEEVSWIEFELEFEKTFNLGMGRGRDALKSIVEAFIRNGQWKNVCIEYTKKNPSNELNSVISEIEKNN
ncbi:MAG: hypothetical protein ACM3SY_06960 [Candidatus Omnitrophota bacterium]